MQEQEIEVCSEGFWFHASGGSLYPPRAVRVLASHVEKNIVRIKVLYVQITHCGIVLKNGFSP